MNTDVKPIALTGATAITPYRRHEDCTLVLEKGKIAQMGHAEDVDIPFDAEVIELDGQYVLPGFIDIHIHGGRGHDFCDEDLRAFDEISEFHASHGTTSLIATVYPQPRDALLASIRRLREYCEMAGP
ncbi:MAG TPA: amidohydrolase family protein, partial [bacterium]|nr:amidohydrolase family protein [bacterium]